MRRIITTAILLTTSLVLGGCPRPKNECPTVPVVERPRPRPDVEGPPRPERTDPFVAARLRRERSVTVDVLWVRRKWDKVRRKFAHSGGTSKVELHVSPNPKGVASIGISEQFPGGVGSSWKASVWLAARTATRILGRELADYRFVASSSGFVNGPSAGALFTVGFMAAILGQKPRPEASMTGMVNPDGTVGVVGGLKEKFLAAIQKGKRILGYPEGNKVFRDSLGRMVNLETLAEQNGARAVPIRDVYEAYKLLTGKEFPEHNRLRPSEMAVGKELPLGKKLGMMLQGWRTKHKAFVKRAMDKPFDKAAQALYEKRLRPAKIYARLSNDAEGHNHLGAAYYAAVRSATWAYSADKYGDVIDLWTRWSKLQRKSGTASQAARRAWYRQWLQRRLQLRALFPKYIACKRKKFADATCRILQVKWKALIKPIPAPRPTAGRPAKPDPKKAEQGEAPPDYHKLLVEKAKEIGVKSKELMAVQEHLKALRPKTLDELLALIAAWEELVQGTAFAGAGYQRFRQLNRIRKSRAIRRTASKPAPKSPVVGGLFRARPTSTIDNLTEQVKVAVKFASIAFGKATIAKEMSRLFAGAGATIKVSPQRMRSITNQLFALAKANLDYVASLMPSGYQGVMIRRKLEQSSPEYMISRIGARGASRVVLRFRLRGYEGKTIDVRRGFVGLGAAVASLVASTKMIAKRFFGVYHKTGESVQFVKRGVDLTNALHRARLFALEAAYRARAATGIVPTFSRVLFEAADMLRAESLSGQVKALELFWRAALYCRLAEMLVRK